MIECVGPDSLSSLPQIVQDLNCKKVYLVTGQNSFRASGAAARFKDLLPGEDVEHFDEVVPNPSIKSIEKAVFSCPEGDDVCVVAVGGGSVLDHFNASSFNTAIRRSRLPRRPLRSTW